MIHVNFIFFRSFSRSFASIASIIWKSGSKTMDRDSIGSKLLKYFKFLISSKIADFDNIGGFNKTRKNSIFLENQRKYRFSSNFLENLVFLTYVNFSLSAKFNRFFIILGGSGCRDQNPRFFEIREKSRFFVDLRGF